MKYKDSKIHTGSLQQKVRKLENPIPGQPVWDWGPGRLRGLSPGCRGLSFDPFGCASLLFLRSRWFSIHHRRGNAVRSQDVKRWGAKKKKQREGGKQHTVVFRDAKDVDVMSHWWCGSAGR